MPPVFPAFVFGQKPHQLFWIPESEEEVRVYSLRDALAKLPGTEVFFDAQGVVWHRRLETAVPYGFLRKLLARTIYNPRISVDSEWLFEKRFALDELKNRVKQCIMEDDDVLTQFVEVDELIARVNRTTTFQEVLTEVNKAAQGEE